MAVLKLMYNIATTTSDLLASDSMETYENRMNSILSYTHSDDRAISLEACRLLQCIIHQLRRGKNEKVKTRLVYWSQVHQAHTLSELCSLVTNISKWNDVSSLQVDTHRYAHGFELNGRGLGQSISKHPHGHAELH